MRAIGIDLGTTNSAAAIGHPEVKVLPTRAGEQLTPSVVSLVKRRRSEEREIVAGRQAYNNAVRDPTNTIFSVKRLMGRLYGERQVEEVRRHASFRVADPPPVEAEDQTVRVLLDGEPYSPTEISAMILRQIKADAELALGEAVTHAVITVPAYFEERQRKATAEAGELAGLQVLNVIDEPTAAAIAFGVGREEQRHRILVYDLGGGTFDISIIQMTGGQYSIMEIRGDNWLGGDDFDQALVTRIAAKVMEDYGFDASVDPVFQIKAKLEAQKAKIALSTQQVAEIFAPLLISTEEVGPVDVELEVSRQEFEGDVRPRIDRTVELVHEALESQSLTPDDITEVLMVGGSTAVPAVQEAVVEIFGRGKVKRHVNPMECVALGAGILAASSPIEGQAETGAPEGPRLDQVTALHLGIAAVRGDNPDVFVPIIERGTPYPLGEPKRRIFFPTAEDQKLIRVPVYEGLSEVASLNEQQGVVEFPLPEGLDRSTAVEVSFNYDKNRLLTVGVRVVGTDHFIEETLRRDRPRMHPAGASQNLVDDWREDLQPSVRAGRHFLETYGDYMDEEDRSELVEAIEHGQQALEDDDRAAGERASLLLRNKIMGSGTASQLFIAERTMLGAPEEAQKVLAQAVAELRSAHARRDERQVEQLSSRLRLTVAQLVARRASIQSVEDRPDLQDLLQVRE